MKIVRLLEETQQGPTLYRGFSDGAEVGQEFSSRTRTSLWNAGGAMMKIWDNLVMKEIPILQGTAPRSNCIIVTPQPGHASEFGDFFEIEVVSHTTPLMWCENDFNENFELNSVAEKLGTFASDVLHLSIPSYDPIPYEALMQLDELVRTEAQVRARWQSTIGSRVSPKDFLMNVYKELFNNEVFGVVQSPAQIPNHATEVWFQGTIKVVAEVEDDEYRGDW